MSGYRVTEKSIADLTAHSPYKAIVATIEN